MKYYAYVKNKKDQPIINCYVEAKNIELEKRIDYSIGFGEEDEDTFIKKNVIEELKNGDVLILPRMSNTLGNSILDILKYIELLTGGNEITLHFIEERLILEAGNESLHIFIKILLKADKIFKEIRTTKARETRKKNNTSLGRPGGKKAISIFDKHKRKIMKLHKQQVPKIKILGAIKSDELDTSRIQKATPQALGKYIKRVSHKQLLQDTKEQIEKILKEGIKAESISTHMTKEQENYAVSNIDSENKILNEEQVLQIANSSAMKNKKGTRRRGLVIVKKERPNIESSEEL